MLISGANNASERQEDVMSKFSDLDDLINNSSNLIEKVNENVSKTIRNTAKIIQTEQEHTIALDQIQADIKANQDEIKERLKNSSEGVKKLQQQNLFLTQTVLEHSKEVDGKLDEVKLRTKTCPEFKTICNRLKSIPK